MQQAENAFAGVAFHCYAGNETQQDSFHTQYPQKEIYFTECSGTIGSDWWSDIKVCAPIEHLRVHRRLIIQLQWYMDNMYVASRTFSYA